MKTLAIMSRRRRATTKDDDQIERRALELYDRLNPEADRVINVSKAKCIRMAQGEILPKR